MQAGQPYCAKEQTARPLRREKTKRQQNSQKRQRYDHFTLSAKPRSQPTKTNDHNQAAFGRQWQGRGVYKGRDSWSNTMLKEGDIVYGGVPGQSGFYFDQAALDAAGGSRTKLWKSLQVLPHQTFGYCGQIQAYRVRSDAIAGTGKALAQDASKGFGEGNGTQFFLSNYKTVFGPICSPFSLDH